MTQIVKNTSRSALESARYRKAKEIFSNEMSNLRIDGKANFKRLQVASKVLGKNWTQVQLEINRYQGEWLQRQLRKNPATKTATAKRNVGRVVKRGAGGVVNPKRESTLAERSRLIKPLVKLGCSHAKLNLLSTEQLYELMASKMRAGKVKLQRRNTATTKRNATASDFRKHQKIRLEDLARMFQGEASGEKRRVIESDYTPSKKYRLGYLVQIILKDGGKKIPIEFEGESYLCADLRNNLHVVGKDSRLSGVKLPPRGDLKYLGELIQIDYVTAKKHIEAGKTVRFFHKLGEVTKEYPNVFIDHEGYLHIQGGAYDVWDVGIVN